LVAVPSIGRASEVTPRRAAPEADATRELYERYARQIYSYCLHQLGNREEAEDATQSTFLNAFRGFKRGVDPEFESAWLYKIAQNVCLTRQRCPRAGARSSHRAISRRCRTTFRRTRPTRTS
jgi:RNA polymerase sigma factor (sigma-70 family)